MQKLRRRRMRRILPSTFRLRQQSRLLSKFTLQESPKTFRRCDNRSFNFERRSSRSALSPPKPSTTIASTFDLSSTQSSKPASRLTPSTNSPPSLNFRRKRIPASLFTSSSRKTWRTTSGKFLRVRVAVQTPESRPIKTTKSLRRVSNSNNNSNSSSSKTKFKRQRRGQSGTEISSTCSTARATIRVIRKSSWSRESNCRPR